MLEKSFYIYYEVMNMNLDNTELVVLSACNTGRGEILKGEGVIGLTRAFMYAGTPALSVNLWSVETISAQKLSVDFFKALKQSLKIKTFVGTSANAVKTQVWTALIAMLVVKYLQLRSQYQWSLSNLVALLRQQLFVYRDLYKWLDEPFQAPPALEGVHDAQLTLPLTG